MATALAVAFIVYSCKGKLSEADRLDLSTTPLQRVEDMFFVQTENGLLKIRVEAPVMESYDNDTVAYELFPEGLYVYGYSADGLLETTIRSDAARHNQPRGGQAELWQAFGNVVVRNEIKQETIETDTIYWDQSKHEIYTDCYLKLYSPSGFMQGYGMRSDDHARNAILLEPFNGYGYTARDSTVVVIDSVNFIGPLVKISK